MAHVINLITWVTNYYVPQTHPLNRIKKARYYGDDLTFAQWRGDLNNSSSTVFDSNRGGMSLPWDCGFYNGIESNMNNYAKNKIGNLPYHIVQTTYTQNDPEYENRLDEYINTIDIDDAPCNNCSYSSDCKQWGQISLIFDDKTINS